MPGKPRAAAAAFATVASTSTPGAGITWIVTSRATSDSQVLAAPPTRITAPMAKQAKNVMMATTATSARPAIDCRGTIGVSKRGMPRPSPRGAAFMPDGAWFIRKGRCRAWSSQS